MWWAIFLVAVAAWGQRVVPFEGLPENAGGIAVSPDGKTIAYNVTGDIRTRAFAGGDETVFVEEDEEGNWFPANLVWSPDGSKLAFTFTSCRFCADRLVVKAFPNGPALELGVSGKTMPAWTPGGKYLIVSSPCDQEDGLCRIDLVPTDGSARTTLIGNAAGAVAVSADGKRLVYSERNVLKLAVLSADFRVAGTPRVIAQEPFVIDSIFFAADGHRVVYQVWNHRYTRQLTLDGGPVSRVLDAGTDFTLEGLRPDGAGVGNEWSHPRSLWRIDLHDAAGHPERVRRIPWTDHDVAVSPNGASIAFETNRNGPDEIWIENFDGTNPRNLVTTVGPHFELGDNTMVDGLSWSPDGRWIAFVAAPVIDNSGVGRLFIVPSGGGAVRALADLEYREMDGPRWSEDSGSIYISDSFESYSRVAVASGERTKVQASDLPARPRTATMSGSVEQPHLVRGRFLYYVGSEASAARPVMIRYFLR